LFEENRLKRKIAADAAAKAKAIADAKVKTTQHQLLQNTCGSCTRCKAIADVKQNRCCNKTAAAKAKADADAKARPLQRAKAKTDADAKLAAATKSAIPMPKLKQNAKEAKLAADAKQTDADQKLN
jgi:colicin import membrane protein